MTIHVVDMGKKRKATDQTPDPIPPVMVRIQPDFLPMIHLLARLRAHRVTQVVNDLVRVGLEKEHLWPVTPEVQAELQKYGLG